MAGPAGKQRKSGSSSPSPRKKSGRKKTDSADSARPPLVEATVDKSPAEVMRTRPSKKRPRLLMSLVILFALWLGVLIWLAIRVAGGS